MEDYVNEKVFCSTCKNLKRDYNYGHNCVIKKQTAMHQLETVYRDPYETNKNNDCRDYEFGVYNENNKLDCWITGLFYSLMFCGVIAIVIYRIFFS